jgi:hypothetical protein
MFTVKYSELTFNCEATWEPSSANSPPVFPVPNVCERKYYDSVILLWINLFIVGLPPVKHTVLSKVL